MHVLTLYSVFDEFESNPNLSARSPLMYDACEPTSIMHLTRSQISPLLTCMMTDIDGSRTDCPLFMLLHMRRMPLWSCVCSPVLTTHTAEMCCLLLQIVHGYVSPDDWLLHSTTLWAPLHLVQRSRSFSLWTLDCGAVKTVHFSIECAPPRSLHALKFESGLDGVELEGFLMLSVPV